MSASAGQISLLAANPSLGRAVGAENMRLAEKVLRVEHFLLQPGAWIPPVEAPESGHLGFMIIEGVITRELLVAGARSLELLNSGDLIRPWQEDAASFVEARWRVLTPTRMMILDSALAARLGRFPGATDWLVERVMQRSRSLAVLAAIGSMRSLEARLLVLFWQMAERWGSVRKGGIHVPLPLTHQMLADLVGARRPSVSTALRILDGDRRVRRLPGEGWLIGGEPPDPSHPPFPAEEPDTVESPPPGHESG